MLLRHVGQVEAHLANSLVLGDLIWDREVSQIQKMDLVLFHARMASHGLTKEAIAALDVLQAEVIKALATGQIQEAPFVTYEVPRPRFAVDELLVGLRNLTSARRQACLLALEEGIDPGKVETMVWSEVLRMAPKTQLAIDLLRERNRLRHSRLPYVFWEHATELVAAPCLNLKQDIEGAFERPWAVLLASYEGILMLDRRAEADSFRSIIAGVKA